MSSPVVLRLSRKQRALVKRHGQPLEQLLYQLYWGEKLTLEKLAERLGVTVGTAEVWLARYGLTRTALAAHGAPPAFSPAPAPLPAA